MKIPELEHHCGSWIVTEKSTGNVVLETFHRTVAEKVNQEKYRVQTAAQYLADLNENVRKTGAPHQ